MGERFENSPGRGGQRLEDVADADEGDGDVADRHDEPAGDEPEGKEQLQRTSQYENLFRGGFFQQYVSSVKGVMSHLRSPLSLVNGF